MCVIWKESKRRSESVTLTLHTVSQLTAKSWWSYCRPPYLPPKTAEKRKMDRARNIIGSLISNQTLEENDTE